MNLQVVLEKGEVVECLKLVVKLDGNIVGLNEWVNLGLKATLWCMELVDPAAERVADDAKWREPSIILDDDELQACISRTLTSFKFCCLLSVTCAAITLCLSIISIHLLHSHFLNRQLFLWPLMGFIWPWFRHRAHFGFLVLLLLMLLTLLPLFDNEGCRGDGVVDSPRDSVACDPLTTNDKGVEETLLLLLLCLWSLIFPAKKP